MNLTEWLTDETLTASSSATTTHDDHVSCSNRSHSSLPCDYTVSASFNQVASAQDRTGQGRARGGRAGRGGMIVLAISCLILWHLRASNRRLAVEVVWLDPDRRATRSNWITGRSVPGMQKLVYTRTDKQIILSKDPQLRDDNSYTVWMNVYDSEFFLTLRAPQIIVLLT